MDNPACQLSFVASFISLATLRYLIWFSKRLNTPLQSSIWYNYWSLELLLSRNLWSAGLSSMLCRSWFLSLKKAVLIKEKQQQQQQHPLTDTDLLVYLGLGLFFVRSWFQIQGLCLDVVWSWVDRLQDFSYQQTRASEISHMLWCVMKVINVIRGKCVG